MNWMNKIQEAIDYIEEYLLENITIESVGKAINYAPSSFQNLFSAVTAVLKGKFHKTSPNSSKIVNVDIC